MQQYFPLPHLSHLQNARVRQYRIEVCEKQAYKGQEFAVVIDQQARKLGNVIYGEK
ncbi:hypothetical protein [Vibrio cionasavignyae]|uniref:hypothetical protein n=1 Tax=Vibrio cionasavignyae TaxID=2910252 RepID=UPI003D118E1D